MRGGLAGNVQTLRLGARDQVQSARRADVDDMQRALRFPGEEDRPLDGFEFGDGGPRGEVISRREPPLGDRLPGESGGDPVVLRVDGDDLL